MLYILGINHSHQDHSDLELDSFIQELVKINNIKILAEEYSKEACIICEDTGLYQLAQELLLQHVYCDPNCAERKVLGIPSSQDIKQEFNLPTIIEPGSQAELKLKQEEKKYWYIREDEWIRRLIPYDLSNTNIFILIGDEHSQSFPKRLEIKNILYKIIQTEKFKNVIS